VLRACAGHGIVNSQRATRRDAKNGEKTKSLAVHGCARLRDSFKTFLQIAPLYRKF